MAIDKPKCVAYNFHNIFGCRGLIIGVFFFFWGVEIEVS